MRQGGEPQGVQVVRQGEPTPYHCNFNRLYCLQTRRRTGVRHLALLLIRFYQRHISPHKGYACAYRLAYGGSGCSGIGLRLIRRYGVLSGCLLLQKRLAYCRYAHLRLRTATRVGWAHRQQGYCDPPCDAGCCDSPCDASCNADCGSLYDADWKEMCRHPCETCPDAVCQCGADSCGSRSEPRQPKKKPVQMPNLGG